MVAKITGIIIDKTHSDGKWYVREMPNKNGDGVQPLFFRREKNDLIGRLIDKLKGAQSAQRYAATHVNELDITNQTSATEITSETLKQNPTYDSYKWDSASLEKFLTDRASGLTPQSGEITTSLINNNMQRANKGQIEKFWRLYDNHKNDHSGEGLTKKEFTRLMKQSVDLMSKRLITNDSSVRDECEAFIRQLCNSDGAPFEWSFSNTELTNDLFTELKEFFIAEATPLGKNTQLMKELLDKMPAQNNEEKKYLSESLLKTAFQIYYADQTSGANDLPQPLPWGPVEIPKTTDEIKTISRGLTSFRFPSTNEYDALKHALQLAVDRRLPKFSES